MVTGGPDCPTSRRCSLSFSVSHELLWASPLRLHERSMKGADEIRERISCARRHQSDAPVLLAHPSLALSSLSSSSASLCHRPARARSLRSFWCKELFQEARPVGSGLEWATAHLRAQPTRTLLDSTCAHVSLQCSESCDRERGDLGPTRPHLFYQRE